MKQSLTPKHLIPCAFFILVSCLLSSCEEADIGKDTQRQAESSLWNIQEKQQLLSLSIRELPKIAQDLSNQYQNNPQAVRLGTKLFFDTKLSESGTISCSICHQPNREFSDGLNVASGLGKGRRNTPSLLGVSHQKWFFWDGRKDSAWAQALVPFEDEAEHNLSRVKLIKFVLLEPEYRGLYRAVFGELVPYGKLWRFGANDATTISTDHSLFFESGELPAGTYSVLAIPNEGAWEIIFNKDENARTEEYSEAKDALRVKAKASDNSFTETLGFDNLRDESATLVILWEKTKVEVPFKVKTNENSIANIKKAIAEGDDLSSVYNNAANFYYSSLEDSKMALDYVNKSVKLGEDYRNLFLKARILFDLGEKDEAVKTGKKSLEYAQKNASKGYQNYISNTIEKW